MEGERHGMCELVFRVHKYTPRGEHFDKPKMVSHALEERNKNEWTNMTI
jgi:hypothetical protein